MKFYTPEVHRAIRLDDDFPPQALVNAHTAYHEHLKALEGTLPANLRPISHDFHVDDALVAKVVWYRSRGELTMTLRCGNIPDGYFDLILRYHGVSLTRLHKTTIARIARGMRTPRHDAFDAYCHELDVTEDGRVEHRILFNNWPQRNRICAWFSIVCDSLEWERVEKPDRKLPRLKDRFQVR